MFNILVDTCVWFDLAKDYQQEPILSVLEELIRQGEITIILPRTVIDEFARNKARIIEENSRSLSGTLKRAKEAVEKFGHPRERRRVMRELNDVDHRIPTLGSAVTGTIERIEKLFAGTPVIEISDSVKLRAAQRGIDRRAPFHRQRNGVDDAILIEIYGDAVASKTGKGTRFAFVTHNTKDFSMPNASNKLPHPDISSSFSRVKSLYFVSLSDALSRMRPGEFADLMFEQQWVEEPRRLGEILVAMDLLFHQVWYNRHQVWRQKIERGQIKLVDKETFPVKNHKRRPIQRNVWEMALKAAARVEKQYGPENLGPWTDFEWGMINGKLSALRWALGDEWDMLDT